jgi:hypothetical protein
MAPAQRIAEQTVIRQPHGTPTSLLQEKADFEASLFIFSLKAPEHVLQLIFPFAVFPF